MQLCKLLIKLQTWAVPKLLHCLYDQESPIFGLYICVFACIYSSTNFSLQEVLQNLYRTKSFLFMGCGETLRDQIFQALFLYAVKNKVDLEHYMLVLKENEDQFFKLQADMLLHGIKVVSYGDRFESFPEYVQDLASQICKQRSPGIVHL